MLFNLIDARKLQLIAPLPAGICYANCPRWHGCDCPPYWHI